MPSPASTRFAMTVSGKPRVFLSVREHVSGRLIVTMQGVGNKLRDAGSVPESTGSSVHHNVRIAQQKFSVHPSEESAEYNQLHFNQILATGEKKDAYHVTSALRSRRFAPLFVKRYSNLNSPVYDPKKASNVVDVSQYDSDYFTAIVFCLIAGKGVKFDHRQYDVDVYQRDFARFSIVLLSSFFCMRATDHSFVTGFVTIAPENATNEAERAILQQVMLGYSAEESLFQFNVHRDLLREEGIRTAERFAPQMENEPKFRKWAEGRYFKSGAMSNKIYKVMRRYG
ncbi:hypothetical protein [Tardiphaga sp. 285_C5_N1_2]|uniref:hypothetical protein n=1 Tax=Tardiphaga sp. 285_C5_N1_2 TaxID=3240775 RepID=UPI003F8884DD